MLLESIHEMLLWSSTMLHSYIIALPSCFFQSARVCNFTATDVFVSSSTPLPSFSWWKTNLNRIRVVSSLRSTLHSRSCTMLWNFAFPSFGVFLSFIVPISGCPSLIQKELKPVVLPAWITLFYLLQPPLEPYRSLSLWIVYLKYFCQNGLASAEMIFSKFFSSCIWRHLKLSCFEHVLSLSLSITATIKL